MSAEALAVQTALVVTVAENNSANFRYVTRNIYVVRANIINYKKVMIKY